LGDARAVGMPAILGIYDKGRVAADLRQRLGVELFELPTMPPAVQGLRLKQTLEEGLAAKGVDMHVPSRVRRVTPPSGAGGCFVLEAGDYAEDREVIHARAVILATGRFLGRGLTSERTRIREALFDLPVTQPASRADWHHLSFFDKRGHPVNMAGLEVDDDFRPLNAAGAPAIAGLFAAGGVLAHQDWIRQKCGAGMAIASAWGAVRGVARFLA